MSETNNDTVTCYKCGAVVTESVAFVMDNEPHEHVCRDCYKPGE